MICFLSCKTNVFLRAKNLQTNNVVKYFLFALFVLSCTRKLNAQTLEYNSLRFAGVTYNVVKVKVTKELTENMLLFSNTGQIGEKRLFDSLAKKHNFIAVNASIVQADCKPLGWWVENAAEIQGINDAQGSGNFYLKPNGFLGVCGSEIILKETDESVQCTQPRWVMQSGPMLVIDRQIHSGFGFDSKNKFLRSGVGLVMEQGSQYLVFAQSLTPVNFYQFANLFLERFNCTDALHLDSGPACTLRMPSLTQYFNDTKKGCRYWVLPLK